MFALAGKRLYCWISALADLDHIGDANEMIVRVKSHLATSGFRLLNDREEVAVVGIS